ncbi:MAG: hypothetical protein Q8N63_02645 [Nanoarchaeota archaeon]|nr:hypothetical protein [Nanoarchaeota archaeon]
MGFKNLARKVLLTAGLAAFCIANSSCSTAPQKKIIEEPLLQPRQVQETKQTNEDSSKEKEYYSKFLGSIYGEAGSYGGIFNANPAMLNLLTGYNIQKKSDMELEKGVLLFPSARVLVRGDTMDNPWNNYTDFGLGATYLKAPFIIGAEGVHRQPFKKEGSEEQFFRLWGGYWDAWQQKRSIEKMKPLSESQDGLWGAKYIGFDCNTLEKNLVADLRVDANLDVLNFNGIIVGPFAKGKVNYDARDKPWYRFGEVGGGIRIRLGDFSLFVESGHRESFNDKGGAEGTYQAVYAGLWKPIRF